MLHVKDNFDKRICCQLNRVLMVQFYVLVFISDPGTLENYSHFKSDKLVGTYK